MCIDIKASIVFRVNTKEKHEGKKEGGKKKKE